MSSQNDNTEVMMIAPIKAKKPRTKKVKVIEEQVAEEVATGFANEDPEEIQEDPEETEGVPAEETEEVLSDISEDDEKPVEEEDNIEEALEILNKKIAEFEEKKKALEFKKKLLTKAGELTAEFIKVRSADILHNEGVIAKLTAENEEFQNQIDEITDIAGLRLDMTTDNADEIMGWFSANAEEFGNAFLFPVEEVVPKRKSAKQVRKAEKKAEKKVKSETTSESSTELMPPVERWANIPAGIQFRAKSKDTTQFYMKYGTQVAECSKDGVVSTEELFSGIQEAANSFRVKAGIAYGISGWEFLQPYNSRLDKAFSLKKWRGNWDEVREFLNK